MAITTKRITMRQGKEADWKPEKMLSAEMAVINDKKELHFAYEDGKTKRIATEDDISQLSEQILNLDVRSITSIEKTSTDGLVDTYTIMMSDETSYTFTVTNGDASDAKIQQFINAWLDEHPEATTTVQDGTITEEKLHPDLVNTLKNSGTDKPYHLQKIGVLYENPEGYDYIAWCPNNLRYDEKLKKYVSLIYASTQHIKGSTATFVSYINPDTFEATAPVQCFTDDGGTALEGVTTFWIEDDGSYKILYEYTDGETYVFTSTDYGVNWVKGSLVNGYHGAPWGITKLSNGRLICGADSENIGIYYSDNDGVNWTKVVPDTVGGDYEAEACILELLEGKLIAIARYSMSGIGYNESGASEPAIVSFSEDYGTTWTPWKKSETITNMNASTCTGYVHNGMVDIFACSRWYWHGDNKNDDYVNTGKTGAITHYTATVENAIADNFTNMGIVAYSNAVGDTSSQDFHSPTMAINGDDMLLMWFDRIYPYTEEITSHYFARGSKADLDTAPRDDLSSVVFSYSSAMVDKLLKQQYTKLMTKINEIVINGGGTPDVEPDPENPTSYIFDGCIMNFNYLDATKYDIENMTLTDTINGVVGTFSTNNNGTTKVDTFPEIREKSLGAGRLFVPENTLSKYVTAEHYELSIEFAIYRYETDEYIKHLSNPMFYSNGNGTNSLRVTSSGVTTWYLSTSGSNSNTSTLGSYTVIDDKATEVLEHGLVTLAKDGTVCAYHNGKLTKSGIVSETFVSWAMENLTRPFVLYGYNKAVRIYNRVLTEDEVLNNYNYELQSLV